MQTIFCTECGAKMNYSGSKPKFCSSCGCSMGGNSKPSSEQPKPEKARRRPPSIREQMEARKQGGALIADDETDIDYVPEMKNGLEYSISNDGFGNATYKFEDVIDVSTEETQQEK